MLHSPTDNHPADELSRLVPSVGAFVLLVFCVIGGTAGPNRCGEEEAKAFMDTLKGHRVRVFGGGGAMGWVLRAAPWLPSTGLMGTTTNASGTRASAKRISPSGGGGGTG